MSSIFLYIGIVLVGVPLMLIIGFASFIFYSFVKDDDMTFGILRVTFLIMGVGLVFIATHFIQSALTG